MAATEIGPVEIVPFEPAHVDGAAQLVAARQARLHAANPAFAQRWADPAEARTLVARAAAAERAHGVVAVEGGGTVRGFLVGGVRLDAPWERAAWVELAGHAVDASAPDLARDLYAAWSGPLVREHGVFRHLVNVPADDRAAVEAWHALNFGQMHANAARATDAADLGAADPTIAIRRAGPGDEAIMASTSELIWREQVGPPSWSPILPERIAALRADYVEELTLDDAVWIASDAASGEALGVSVSYPLDPDLDVPDGSMKLASTTTFPGARRRGVARALLREVLRHASAQGATWCVTDWRTSSLLASRAWTGLGFRPTRLRLERRIDARMAWADGHE
jgi:ribosomal protein S18 acetylase RimI-like enzyme